MFLSQTDLVWTILSATNIEDINQVLPYLEFFAALSTIAGIAIGVVKYLGKLFRKVLSPYLVYNHFLKCNYSKEYREALSKYYIPTRAQEIDPCNQEEIRNNNGKFYSFLLISFFKKEAFKRSSTGKYYLVLADSGMGKTTFLLKLYKECVRSMGIKKKKKVEMLPLAERECIEKMKEIPDADKTVLLLDGLDENNDAIEDCDTFFSKLISATMHFNKVVITCRTQFYASASDEPSRTGVIHVGNENKSCEIVRKYISPFSDEEVKLYLRKRFRFKKKIQQRALSIVNFVPDLMVRPIVLNWIEFLCDAKEEYQYTFQIYDTIIQKWIEREALGSNSNKLYELSADIANYMYQAESTTIPADRVDKIALKKHIDLKPIIAKSRSLLNRNSAGEYKFAHRSFLEYFIVDNILRRMVIPDNTNFLWSLSGAKCFLFERLIYAAVRTDRKQFESANKQITDNVDYSDASNVMDFLRKPKIKMKCRNDQNRLIVEAWLYYLPVEGYDGNDKFNITRYFSTTEGPIHQPISNEGIDIGVVFEVGKKDYLSQTYLTAEVRKKHVLFAVGAKP